MGRWVNRKMAKGMVGWMDGWVDGWLDGWMVDIEIEGKGQPKA
jgi:hypothetical protein